MDMPVFGFMLKGELEGYYSVTVRANWRVILRFANHDAYDVDYVDYHGACSRGIIQACRVSDRLANAVLDWTHEQWNRSARHHIRQVGKKCPFVSLLSRP